MRINHNISAMNTYRQLSTNTVNSNKSMEKLSSGLRINRAADDAAGLSISEKMRSQIRGLTQATRNAQDGISFIQTAEGALGEVSDMLVRLKELAVQVNNGTYSDVDRANIGKEMNALGNAVKDIYSNTKFNGREVFGITSLSTTPAVAAVYTATDAAADGTDVTIFGVAVSSSEAAFNQDAFDDWMADTASKSLRDEYNITLNGTTVTATAKTAGAVGNTGPTVAPGGSPTATTAGAEAAPATPNTVAAEIFYGEGGSQKVTIATATTTNLAALTTLTDAASGATGTGAVSTDAANAMLVSVTAVEAAIDEVNTTRAAYGAQQNQLEHMSNNMAATKENLQSAESRIRDVDMADEMAQFTKNNILTQAAQAMLAQANSQPQGVLQLLR